MDNLTPAERRVARQLLAEYPVAGLVTVAELADLASTSAATVVRLVQKLGFDGYPAFQASLRDELSVRRTGPIERLGGADPEWQRSDFGRITGSLTRLAESTAATVPEPEFDAAVALLADTSRHLYLVGGSVTHSLAEYLEAHLVRLRRRLTVLSQQPSRRSATLLDVARRDVLVAFDFRRYERETLEVVRLVDERGGRIILVTDVLLSPAAAHAAVVLPVQVETPTPFDSAVAGMVLVEALALATLTALGDAGVERMRSWDAVAARGLLGE